MGGLAQAHARDATTFLIGCVAISRHPSFGGLLEQGRDPRPGASTPSPCSGRLGFLTAGNDRLLHVPALPSPFEGPFPRHRCRLKAQVMADAGRVAMEEEGRKGIGQHARFPRNRLADGKAPALRFLAVPSVC